jgi:hypothetical protein
MQKNIKLLIGINMGITSWYIVDATQQPNTPTAKKNNHMLYLIKLTEYCLKNFDMMLNINCATFRKQNIFYVKHSNITSKGISGKLKNMAVPRNSISSLYIPPDYSN